MRIHHISLPSFLSSLAFGCALALTAGCGDDEATDSDGADDDNDDDTDGTDGTDDGSCSVEPSDWEAADWETNTVEALALRAQLGFLTGAETMRGAEQGTVTIADVATLEALLEAGSPSLASVTTSAYQDIVDDSFAEFVTVVEAGAQDLIDDGGEWTPGTDGGIFGDGQRGLNEGGLELRQLVDKGLFSGGAFYNYAVSLTVDDPAPADIDAIAAIWGANSALDAAGELDDAASYGHQMGFHGAAAEQLIAAKAYAGDEACTSERDAALVEFFNIWEQSMLARLVYYASETGLIMATATTDTEFADALHELAEGLGLAMGFYGLPNPASGPLSTSARIITDDQLDAIMVAFGVNLTNLGASTTGEFVENLPAYEVAQEAAEAVVMEAYGLDATAIQSYRTPTPG